MSVKTEKIILSSGLHTGDAVGIVTPASPFDEAVFRRGLSVLESMGFRAVYDDGIFQKERFLAGDDPHRADQINRYFTDPTIRAVLCARGGYGSMRVLPLLDYEAIGKNPKPFIGFSDITALHWALHSRCGLVTFHGPTVTTLAKATPTTLKSFLSVLTAGSSRSMQLKGTVSLYAGAAFGKLTGGNLTTLCHLVGTSFHPIFRDYIVLLEDVDEAPYRVDRMLTQMILAGCFEGVAGIALGSFRRCGKIDEIHQIFADAFRNESIPVLAGLPVGHRRKNKTVPLGVQASLDTDRKLLSFGQAPSAGG